MDMCVWQSIIPGTTRRPRASIATVLASLERRDLGVAADRDDPAVPRGEGRGLGTAGISRPDLRRQEDQVRRLTGCGRRHHEKQEEISHSLRRHGDAALPFGECGAGGGQTGDRDPVRRAGDVVETDRVKELDRVRIAAVLAADADFQLRVRLASALRRQGHELPHAGLIEAREGIFRKDPLLDVCRQKDAASSRE
jgi:hypothetical protein